MFDFFKVSIYAFTGKLKNHPTLRKAYWAFLFVIILSLIALGYNAFMSFSFYLSRLDQLPFAQELSWLVTIGIALGVYFCMSFVAGFTLDLWNGRKEKTEGFAPLFLFCCLVLLGAVSWDIFANLEGVDPVSHKSTVFYQENQEASVRNQYTTKIEEKKLEIAQIKHLYSWCPTHGKEALGKYCSKNVLNFLPYPTTSVSKSRHRKNVAQVNRIQNEITELERLQAKAINAALDDYERDKSRYDTSVQRKQITHTTIVKFIYIVVLLIAFMTNAYMDAVIEFVEGENPDPEPPSGLQKLDERVSQSSNGQLKENQVIGFLSDSTKTEARLTVPPKSLIVRDIRTVSKQGYEITCQNCGKKAIKNSPNRAKYCSTECRKEAYEKRMGKEIRV
ncbi:MAG: hypothetical protein AAFY45_18750 [Bacteroidota bacterium]